MDPTRDSIYTEKVLRGVAEYFGVVVCEVMSGKDLRPEVTDARTYACYFLRAETSSAPAMPWGVVAGVLGVTREWCREAWAQVEADKRSRQLLPELAARIGGELIRKATGRPPEGTGPSSRER